MPDPVSLNRAAILRSECYYKRQVFIEQLRVKLEEVIEEQLQGEPSGDNASLALATAIKLCMIDEVSRTFAMTELNEL